MSLVTTATGQRAIVTGATSSIGAATARRLAQLRLGIPAQGCPVGKKVAGTSWRSETAIDATGWPDAIMAALALQGAATNRSPPRVRSLANLMPEILQRTPFGWRPRFSVPRSHAAVLARTR